ncbi:MAG: hypothetical protein NC347_05505 [Clostridium sp.]|nr:hypothetical protein [Clostridium sp.]
MVRVLCIGLYSGEGKFTKEQWKCFIKWCEKECNKIIIYSPMLYSAVCLKFLSYCTISALEKPDETMDVYAYEINVENVLFWNYVKDYNYNIDSRDNISHIFFYNNGSCIASLATVDYENYLVVEEPVIHEEKLLPNKTLIQENIQLCMKGKADIDGLLQGEDWEPLGRESKL